MGNGLEDCRKVMKTVASIWWVLLWTLGAVHAASAQNLVVRNAHILDGNGGTIDSGTLIIRNGRISAYEVSVDTDDFTVLDAEGRICLLYTSPSPRDS